MNQAMTFMVNWRLAKRYGVRQAAVFGWIFAYCQREVPYQRGVCRGRGWVRVSQEELGRRLGISRHTVGKILWQLVRDGLVTVARTRKQDRTRWYTIAPDGFRLLRVHPREWHIPQEAVRLSWGANEAVCAKVGVNAAVVFQYLWFWLHNWKWKTPSKNSASIDYSTGANGQYSLHPPTADAVWLPYTTAELARWLPFMSDDVIADALHTLERAGLLLKLQQGRLTKWAIGDEGFRVMADKSPLRQDVEAGADLASTYEAVTGSVLKRAEKAAALVVLTAASAARKRRRERRRE